MRVLYYMEKELANFDSSRPGPPNGRVERGEEPWGLRDSCGGWGKHVSLIPAPNHGHNPSFPTMATVKCMIITKQMKSLEPP